MPQEMEDLVIGLKRCHRTSRTVVGADANVSLAPCQEGDGQQRKPMAGSGDGMAAHRGLVGGVHFCGWPGRDDWDQAGAAGQQPEQLGSWTHCNFNGGGLFLLDRVLVSALVLGTSGHWPMDAKLRLERKELWSEVSDDDHSRRGLGSEVRERSVLDADRCERQGAHDRGTMHRS